MQVIRSLFFGGLAMLAAVVFMNMPASAFEREEGLYSTIRSMEAVCVMPSPEVVLPDTVQVPKSRDAHRAVYIRQNQPMTTWRFAVETFDHIDPHIRAL